MKTRIKPQVTTKKIESVDQVNNVIKEIGLLMIAVDTIQNEVTEKVNKIKDDGLARITPLKTQIDELSESIGIYAQYNRNELFESKKSIELTFGTFGFRKSTSIHTKMTTLDKLKELGMDKYIRVTESPNKEVMSDLTDEELLKVDANRKVVDDFFVEPNREIIKKNV